MSQSPVQLGATFWWRCDQGLSLDGSNLVTSWQDSIAGKYLIQPNAAGRPGITSGRYTTTAVNFDVAGTSNPGLYAGATSSTSDVASNWTFLHNGTTWHIFVVCRQTNINAARNGAGSRALINNFSSLGGAGFNGAWLSWSKASGQMQSRVYNANSAIIAGNAGVWDPTASPGTVIEYRLQDDGGAGADLFTTTNTNLINSATRSGNFATGAGGVLFVGADGSGGYTSPSQYTAPWGGYVEDIVIFNGTALSGASLTNLRDYFRELRGVPTGLALGQGNATMAYALTTTTRETFGPSGGVTGGFTTAGNLTSYQPFTGDIPTGFVPVVNEMAYVAAVGNVAGGFEVFGGSLAGQALITADIPWGFEVDAPLGKALPSSGNIPFDFTLDGPLIQADLIPLTGDASMGMALADTDLVVEFKGLVGHVHVGFDAVADLQPGHLEGALNVGFEAAGVLAINSFITANIPWSFNLAEVDQVLGEDRGAITFSFDAAADLAINYTLPGAISSQWVVNGSPEWAFNPGYDVSGTIDDASGTVQSSESALYGADAVLGGDAIVAPVDAPLESGVNVNLGAEATVTAEILLTVGVTAAVGGDASTVSLPTDLDSCVSILDSTADVSANPTYTQPFDAALVAGSTVVAFARTTHSTDGDPKATFRKPVRVYESGPDHPGRIFQLRTPKKDLLK